MQQAGIYIHVPFCAVRCPYCDFYSLRYDRNAAERYTEAVCRNLNALPAGLPCDTVYFGGGTPSLLPPAHIARMLHTLRARVCLASSAEITLEANPLTAVPERLSAWAEAGVNRLSLGIQSFDAETLRQLGRRHTPQQAIRAAESAKEAGFANLSADLMLGLALQTPELLRRELETALSLPLAHLSVYLLKIEQNTPFAASHPALLSEDAAAERWEQMHNILTGAGFLHYEISNFARSGFESRHNLKYWQCAPYYGIGPAAHACRDGKRLAVVRDLAAFCDAETQPETVTDADPLTEGERIMLGLRLAAGIRLRDYPQYGEVLRRAARPLIPQYLTLTGDTLAMTPQGWLVSNAVLAQLLIHIP